MVNKNLKPGISKRHFLFVATAVWSLAGSFLLYRGTRMIPAGSIYLLPKILLAVLAGLLMFHLLFLRISLSHINRIRSMEILRPCIFSFFDWKSYLIMVVMIASGILIRKSDWIEEQWIALFFIAMANPFLLSAVRFLRAWGKYEKIVN